MPAQEDIQPGNLMELVEVEVREFLEKAFRGEEEVGCPKGLLIMHLSECFCCIQKAGKRERQDRVDERIVDDRLRLRKMGGILVIA